ncbi:leucyl/phenylalanyl-tRNA--protein transferase [Bartonella tamiae]|uniref:Leucyl/phenylalanyl-tRNA--protein transferase n=1 Tax=Bartonella tamiae Th239 TaxID=1094558 RepID=J0ZK66_9HYPH|nr:leucyl/phenylalanyl-tRNA--protein transferase [Bartonella tamiae]EJF88733.1 leucyl/phenylalanyl-tRNA-protein transferase [Bartonella tamiae Th239]EJF95017.1 leucyl/phenylalanyl-tRNA-protein transferase [Bartonella tamiae Th307]
MTNNWEEILDPALLLDAYAQGIFPMSEDKDDPNIFWVRPEKRGIIPLDNFHISKSLSKFMKKKTFEICIDKDFEGVISGCAQSKKGRETTWINKTIRHVYKQLFELGYCHTVEAWQDNQLVGGLYGISLGQAFFGESMFSNVPNASKICLVHLVNRLKQCHFILLDTQFITPHLERFGAKEITREKYEILLNNALKNDATFR